MFLLNLLTDVIYLANQQLPLMNPTASQSFFERQINDIWQFAAEPTDAQSDKSFSEKLAGFGFVYVINLFAAMFFGWLIDVAITALKLEQLMEGHKLNALFDEYPLPVIALLAVVVMPLLEEIIFRLPIRFHSRAITFLLAFIVLYVISATYSNKNIVVTIGVMVAVGVCISLYFIYNKKIIAGLGNFWQRHFAIVFYVFTLLFALVHLGNYPFSLVIVLLCPLLVSPQFLMGFMAGYLRVRFGFFWGVALHMLHNGLFMIPMLLIGTSSPVEVNNKDFTLSIKDGKSPLKYEMQNYANIDSVGIENYNLKGSLAILLDKQEKFIEVDNPIISNKPLSIHYINKNKGNDSTSVTSYKAVIVKELEKAYHFNIETTSKSFPHLEVYVKDKLKLGKLVSKQVGDPSTTVSNDTITFTNCSLKIIAATLNSEYSKVQFYTDADDKQQYNFKVPKKELEDIKAYLYKNAGLAFRQSSKKVEITTVVFE